MTRRQHFSRRLSYLLPATMLAATFGTLRTAAADFGYPPPPGPYRSESQMPRPAQQPAEHATTDSVGTGAPASRGGAGLLPLPADTFSASDTADLLFGALPTLPPSAADANEPAQRAAKDGVPPPPTYPQTGAPVAPPEDSGGWTMEYGHEMWSPAYPDPGIPTATQYPSHAPAYPDYRQPSPPYYPGDEAYPGQPENRHGGYPASGGYEAPYPMGETYGTFRPAE